MIIYKLGKTNIVVNILSRLPFKLEDVDGSFLDEHFFSLSLKTPWYVDISNYLVAGKKPPHFSPREKRQLVHGGFPYS